MKHLCNEKLSLYLQNQLIDTEKKCVIEHVRKCDSCLARMIEIHRELETTKQEKEGETHEQS